MHRLPVIAISATLLLPLPVVAEYAGQGVYSPHVTISGANCQGITANMSTRCTGRCDTIELHLNVQNYRTRPVNLKVQSRVSGKSLVNGGFTDAMEVRLEPGGSYSGSAINIFAASDLAVLDITDCFEPE